MIYLLTGDRQSGKTTSLLNWIKDHQNTISGILSPIESGGRCFYSISREMSFPFSVIDNAFTDDEVLKIGKYIFYKSAFEKAVYEIEEGIKSNSEYVIIDELGPLELQKKGFYNITKKCINASRSKNSPHFIFVIRNFLLDEMVEFFNINKDEFKIITTENIFNICN